MAIWNLFRRGEKKAPAGVGNSISGHFDVRGDRLSGTVEPEFFAQKIPLDIEVRRLGKVLAACQAPLEAGRGLFAFTLPIEGRFSLAELVDETVEVFARNARGDEGALRLDGATQLELIRDHLGVPSMRVLDLDFTAGGNARPYLGVGWSGAERDYTWTLDDESSVDFPAPSEPGLYALRLTLGPCLRPPDILRQDMQVLLNDTLVGTIVLTRTIMQFEEFKLSGDLFTAPRAALRFRHPDAFRPSDHGESTDTRRLAFCFKRLSLVRLLDTSQ